MPGRNPFQVEGGLVVTTLHIEWLAGYSTPSRKEGFQAKASSELVFWVVIQVGQTKLT